MILFLKAQRPPTCESCGHACKDCEACGYACKSDACANPMCATHGDGAILFKAQIRGGAAGDLFPEMVQVQGHMRGGKYVAPFTSTRKKRHEPASESKPSDAIKHFYVSAIDGSKRYLVAGPYASHDEAKAQVEGVRKHADRDPRAHFMAWGTAGTAEPVKTPLGEWRDNEVPAKAAGIQVQKFEDPGYGKAGGVHYVVQRPNDLDRHKLTFREGHLVEHLRMERMESGGYASRRISAAASRKHYPDVHAAVEALAEGSHAAPA